MDERTDEWTNERTEPRYYKIRLDFFVAQVVEKLSHLDQDVEDSSISLFLNVRVFSYLFEHSKIIYQNNHKCYNHKNNHGYDDFDILPCEDAL